MVLCVWCMMQHVTCTLYNAANRIKCVVVVKIDITIVGFIYFSVYYFLVDWNGFVCFCHSPSSIRFSFIFTVDASIHLTNIACYANFLVIFLFNFFLLSFRFIVEMTTKTTPTTFSFVHCSRMSYVCKGINNWLTFNHIIVHFNRNTFSIASTYIQLSNDFLYKSFVQTNTLLP